MNFAKFIHDVMKENWNNNKNDDVIKKQKSKDWMTSQNWLKDRWIISKVISFEKISKSMKNDVMEFHLG